MFKKVGLVGAALVVLASGQAAFAGGSEASVSSSCSQSLYGLCEYWGQSYDGAHSMIYNVTEVANLPVSGSTSYVFLSSGSGQNQYLGNNNGSLRNYADVSINLFYNTNYSGPELTLGQGNVSGSGSAKKGSEQGSLLNNLRSLIFNIP